MPREKIALNLAEVETLAATGASMDAIARCLGISPSTLYARQRESEVFKETVEKGRARAEAAYAEALKEIALGKDERGRYLYETKHRLKALTFFLERRPGWQRPFSLSTDGAPSGSLSIEWSSTEQEI